MTPVAVTVFSFLQICRCYETETIVVDGLNISVAIVNLTDLSLPVLSEKFL